MGIEHTRLAADKGYDSKSNREHALRHGMKPYIPERKRGPVMVVFDPFDVKTEKSLRRREGFSEASSSASNESTCQEATKFLETVRKDNPV